MLETHYYGGIKKYQWVTLPLAMHGVIVRKDGSSVQAVSYKHLDVYKRQVSYREVWERGSNSEIVA